MQPAISRPALVIPLLLCAGLSTQVSQAGLLFLASFEAGDNEAAIADPRIEGALMTYYWSQIETRDGVYDWSDIDRRIQLWSKAGKKVALRIVWSADGNWPNPWAKHPTPQWVFDKGAVMVLADKSRTEIPLSWDPIYLRFQRRFVAKMAEKYDGDARILFVDLTPGAESNPYRYSLHQTETGLRERFLQATASDGNRYSDERWVRTAGEEIAAATRLFRRTPVLVTLNVQVFEPVGKIAVANGCYVGQNGLKGDSYTNPNGPWTKAFRNWSGKTRLYFEMFGPANAKNGTLMENMLAAQRVGANYLSVYAVDVLKGIPGQPRFDPAHRDALDFGAKVVR